LHTTHNPYLLMCLTFLSNQTALQPLLAHSRTAHNSAGHGSCQAQNDRMRTVLRILAGHGENTVLAPFDVFYLLPCAHLEVGAVEDLVPKSKQVFLGKFSLLELAIHRKFDRAGHHQLLTRVLGHSAANLVTFERELPHLVLHAA